MHHLYPLYIGALQYLGELVDISLGIIQFGAADGDSPPFEKIGVEIGIGEGDAIST